MNSNETFKSKFNPCNIELLSDLTKDSFGSIVYDNTFIIYKSIDDILYLIYSSQNNSTIFFNLLNQQKICEIKNKNYSTSSYRAYLDKTNKRDLLIMISRDNNNIIIYNLKDMHIILHLKDIYEEGEMYSSCFLNINNNIYIATSNCNFEGVSKLIYVFDLKGNKIKEITESNNNIYYIDFYYDKKQSKNYIISSHYKYIRSYDYDNNKLYYTYSDGDIGHFKFIINSFDEENIKIIESSWNGKIRIWNFHSGELLKKMELKYAQIREICLWDENYLFLGCDDNKIKLLNLNEQKEIKSFNGHKDWILSIKKVLHPKYGECLISQGYEKDQIKMWIIKN